MDGGYSAKEELESKIKYGKSSEIMKNFLLLIEKDKEAYNFSLENSFKEHIRHLYSVSGRAFSTNQAPRHGNDILEKTKLLAQAFPKFHNHMTESIFSYRFYYNDEKFAGAFWLLDHYQINKKQKHLEEILPMLKLAIKEDAVYFVEPFVNYYRKHKDYNEVFEMKLQKSLMEGWIDMDRDGRSYKKPEEVIHNFEPFVKNGLDVTGTLKGDLFIQKVLYESQYPSFILHILDNLHPQPESVIPVLKNYQKELENNFFDIIKNPQFLNKPQKKNEDSTFKYNFFQEISLENLHEELQNRIENYEIGMIADGNTKKNKVKTL